jgi:hypothetical protein
MVNIRTTFASPSSFLTTQHRQPGDERDAASTAESRDETSYQVVALPFEPPNSAALATGQPPRN